MPSTNIKNLSVTQLLAMRGDIDKLLQSKRTELQAQLAQIGGDGGGVRKAGSVKGTKVAPKYRQETGRFSDRKAGAEETRQGQVTARAGAGPHGRSGVCKCPVLLADCGR